MIKTLYREFKTKLNNFFLSPSIHAIKALPNNGEVCLLDIGAAGEVEPRWKPYTQFLHYIGVEPDERSRSKLNKMNMKVFKSYQVLPYALTSKKQTLNFNLCKKPLVSSLYEPNTKFLSRFLNVERFDVVEKISIDCVSLDSVDPPNFDFLKIDIQGAENDVLEGASGCISSALGLDLEVEFIELYKGQPLFGDICETLSKNDFEFFDFVRLERWERNIYNHHGQCVFGDALFLRTPEFMIKNSFNTKKWSAYFTILIVYRRFDLIETALNQLPVKYKSEFESFSFLYHKAKKRDMMVKQIHSAFNRLLISFIGNSYKGHLIR